MTNFAEIHPFEDGNGSCLASLQFFREKIVAEFQPLENAASSDSNSSNSSNARARQRRKLVGSQQV
jgi:hypothetical protein